MASAGAGRLALVLMGFTFLTACEDGELFDKPLFSGNKGDQAATDAAGTAVAGATIERDVEAPEVFQKTDQGLWDGRPSLGGVWIAHPDVTDPERVIIRNEKNGKSIIGALFRRERENPGPRFQLSSDAASELGMLAGAPISLNVTAMRREVVQITPPPAETVETIEAPEEIAQATIAAPETPNADPLTAIAASAIEAATSTPATATPSTGTAPTKPAVSSAPAKASSLSKPFIQIGIFSVQSNANSTADLLRKAGVIPTIKTFTSSGKKYWRVVVGPAANSSGRKALLKKVQGLGFGDAYSVTH